ncbi:MAG: response regulator [Limnochordia bacterium]|nr:response regulator [Bacillota bacterium]
MEKRIILIVDDDHSFLETAREVLEAEGFEVVTASSSRQGLEHLQQNLPDLIIVDLSTDDGDDGFRFYWALRGEKAKEFSHIPLIAVTLAYSTTLYNFAEYKYGEFLSIDDLLPKSIDGKVLTDKVKQHLPTAS